MTLNEGIFVHAEKGYYLVFFDKDDDKNRKQYEIGGLIREILNAEAFDIATIKVGNSVKCFPYYSHSFSYELMLEGYEWMCGFLDEDDKYPVAMAIARASLKKTIIEATTVLEAVLDKITIGEFMDACTCEHSKEMSKVLLTIGALTFEEDLSLLEEPDMTEPEGFQPISSDEREHLLNEFQETVNDVSATWGSKHKNQKSITGNDERIVRVIQLISAMDVLVFEQCRIQKENRKLKRCENCGNIFLTGKRIDEKYCEGPSPSNPERTCREVGGNNRRKWKRQTDSELREKDRQYALDYKHKSTKEMCDTYYHMVNS